MTPRELVFLKSATEKHPEGCDCGKCNTHAISHVVEVRSVLAPDSPPFARFSSSGEVSALCSAFSFCDSRGLRRVEKDEDYISGSVLVPLSEIVGEGLESFLDRISSLLTGSDLLQDIDYKLVGTKGDSVRLVVTGGIKGLRDAYASYA